MKCPNNRCQYVSFEWLSTCRKCGADLAAHKSKFNINFPEPISLGILSFAGAGAGAATEAASSMDGGESFGSADFMSPTDGMIDSDETTGIGGGEDEGGLASEDSFGFSLDDSSDEDFALPDSGGGLDFGGEDDETSAEEEPPGVPDEISFDSEEISLGDDDAGDEGGMDFSEEPEEDISMDIEPEPEEEISMDLEPEPEPEPEISMEPEEGISMDIEPEPEIDMEPEIEMEPEEEISMDLEPEPEIDMEPEEEISMDLEPEIEEEPEIAMEPELEEEPEIAMEPELDMAEEAPMAGGGEEVVSSDSGFNLDLGDDFGGLDSELDFSSIGSEAGGGGGSEFDDVNISDDDIFGSTDSVDVDTDLDDLDMELDNT